MTRSRPRPHLVLVALGAVWPASAPAAAPELDPGPGEELGRPCDEDFLNACPAPLVCLGARCSVPVETSTRTATPTRPERPPAPPVREARAFRLGVQSAFWFGFAGSIENPRPAYTVAADFGFPTGRRARWHVELGYQDLNGYTGLRINPFVLGYSIPILEEPFELEVEIVAAILQSEILWNDGYSIALSSGLRAQVLAVYGPGFVAFAPLGFEIRYAYGLQDIGIETGAGANWPLVLTLGVEL